MHKSSLKAQISHISKILRDDLYLVRTPARFNAKVFKLNTKGNRSPKCNLFTAFKLHHKIIYNSSSILCSIIPLKVLDSKAILFLT